MEIGLLGLIRVAWIAGILPIVIASLPCSRLGLIHAVILGFAKRGKILPSSSHHKLTVPQRFFAHFYVGAVIWTTVLLFTTWIYAYRMASLVPEPVLFSNMSSAWLSVFLLLLMEVQVLRRLLETIYVFNYGPSARMHIFGYLTGLFFYIAAPLSLCCTCVPEVFAFWSNEATQFIIKDNNMIQSMELDWWDFVNPLLKLGWCQWIGAMIAFWGMIHQHRCHAILGSLRKHGGKADEYVIPYGDWFKIVSSPHYLAEIIIYAGLVFACRGAELTIWFLFAFVVPNLTLTAAETHSLFVLHYASRVLLSKIWSSAQNSDKQLRSSVRKFLPKA